MVSRKVSVAVNLLAVVVGPFTHASASSDTPSNALRDNPTSAAFFGDGSLRGSSSSIGSVLHAASSPTSGQMSFRTKTRNGVRGLLPKLRLLRRRGKKGPDDGLDTTKRFLHVTADALVLEVEGEDECLSISRGPESLGGARVTVVARKDASLEGTGSARGPPSERVETRIAVDGLFGVYNLLSGPFVAVISKSKLRYANSYLGVEFRQVSQVRLIPILAVPRALDDGQAREEARLLALLALAFRSHQFYFSHAHDVTQTLQTLRVSSSSSYSSTPAPGTTPKSKLPSSASSTLKSLSSGGAFSKQMDSSPASKDQKKKTNAARTAAGHQRRGGRRQSIDGVAATSPAGAAAAGTASPTAAAVETREPPPPDPRFFWNLGVLGPLLELRDELEENGVRNPSDEIATEGANKGVGEGTAAVAAVDRWLTPVMSGFLQVERDCRVGDKSFDVMFVSRRSRLRQGTRYTRRGIDDGGNVANFVETEQALLHEDRSVTSHVQIRGSIPVLWSSPTNLRYHPKVRIDPDGEASLRALRRHSEDLIRLYGKNGGGVVFVNLVDKKKDQGLLGETFGAALKAVEDGAGADDVPDESNTSAGSGSAAGGGGDETAGESRVLGGGAGGEAPTLAGSLRHVWFDFHHECRNMHWENLDKLLGIVDREVGDQGFYHAGPGGEVLSVQDGVVRTNCMDCLDRTNVVQSLLARRSMLVQLRAVGVNIPEPEGGDSAALALTLDMLEMPAEELERRFRDVWGNNADEISMLYAGTPALKGDFTRTGHRTKVGLLQDGTNSAIRYVVNNFQDHRRQEAVDLLLGVHRPVVDKEGNIMAEFIQEPLDLDLWATRLSQPQQQPRQQQQLQERSAALAAASEKRGGALAPVNGPSFCRTTASSPATLSKDGPVVAAAAVATAAAARRRGGEYRGGRGGGGGRGSPAVLLSSDGAAFSGGDGDSAAVFPSTGTGRRGGNANRGNGISGGKSRYTHPNEQRERALLLVWLMRDRSIQKHVGTVHPDRRRRKMGMEVEAGARPGSWPKEGRKGADAAVTATALAFSSTTTARDAEGAADGRGKGVGMGSAVVERRKGVVDSGLATSVEATLKRLTSAVPDWMQAMTVLVGYVLAACHAYLYL